MSEIIPFNAQHPRRLRASIEHFRDEMRERPEVRLLVLFQMLRPTQQRAVLAHVEQLSGDNNTTPPQRTDASRFAPLVAQLEVLETTNPEAFEVITEYVREVLNRDEPGGLQ